MTGAEIVQSAREDYLDDAVTPYLWSDALLGRYANLAETEACRRASLLYDKTTTTDLETKAVNAAVQIDVDATALTFTRLSGSFILDGFRPGDAFTGAAFTNAGNHNPFVIGTVTALVITVRVGTGMVNETGSGDEILTARYPLCSLNIVAGVATYTVSKKILRTLNCVPTATSRTIEKKTEDWLDEFYPTWRSAEGDPFYFLEDKNKITLVPQPVSDDTAQLVVVRLPLSDMVIGRKSVTGITRAGAVATANLPGHGYLTGDTIAHAGADQPEYNVTTIITKISNDLYSYPVLGVPATPATGTITAAISDSPEIPEEYHMDLIEWICHLAYLKQDGETEELGRSDMYEAKFTQKFGPKLSAITESNRRRKPRNKSLRPKEFGFS